MRMNTMNLITQLTETFIIVYINEQKYKFLSLKRFTGSVLKYIVLRKTVFCVR